MALEHLSWELNSSFGNMITTTKPIATKTTATILSTTPHLVLGVYIGAPLEEHARDLGVALVRGMHQGR